MRGRPPRAQTNNSLGALPTPRILLTGPTGQLGWELRRSLAPQGDVLCSFSPDEGGVEGGIALDLADVRAIRRVLREVRPEIIVNAAAYTAVDRAEDEPTLADAVNAIAPGVLAEEAKRFGALVVHFSTDYVFQGDATQPYREEDPVEPVSAYGKSKWAGEEAVRACTPRHLIFRTSWLYGTRGRNFLLTILRIARDGRPLRIVDDQVGAPTPARLLAEATAGVLAQARARDETWLTERTGTYHVSMAGSCTWYRFAETILRRTGDAQALSRLEPISSAQYPAKASRPPYSVLDSGKLQTTFGFALGPWEQGLARVLEDLPSST